MDGISVRRSREHDPTSFDGIFPRLVSPEVLLPTQFYQRMRQQRVLEGERRLMLAILEDAVACFQKYAGATRPRSRRLFQEAEDWFFDTDSSWVFSFESICSVLNIDAQYFRRNLLRWKEELLAQPPEVRAKIGRVRLRAARRHKILPFVPRRRKKNRQKAAPSLA
ncbi:hypothetical protein HRbin30_02835 [bacterium HR30]|nr:hypothetical protein HRbin30_02835 [bacterium HR30]